MKRALVWILLTFTFSISCFANICENKVKEVASVMSGINANEFNVAELDELHFQSQQALKVNFFITSLIQTNHVK